ncbi:C6 zinc finger protein [Plectosphaerella plurivora]|uniref:C6 zinc finger protein n=1 Tax=Plectosphaerella plurivora TaxID=936078 RepID=A0A9P9ACK5_9PEZI|nr:C6 zinc finger protein [Plectosphaerella plurivora]
MDGTRAQPTLMPMPGSPLDFDYNVFLQDEGLTFNADDAYSSATMSDPGSGQNTTPTNMEDGGNLLKVTPPGTGTSSGSRTSLMPAQAPAPAHQSQAQAQKQRMERRGHTKSRSGCFNCKRRRIKCQETRPSCGHCVKTGLKCEYPALPRIVHQPHHQIPLFSLQDMRFFQHFLLRGYPHHPVGNENIWTHEVPCLSQTHEFLMHAILGLAACDLAEQEHEPFLLQLAMGHRVKAIRAIKKALAEMPRRSVAHDEANALIATCFALTFQSVTFDDGMVEFMTFIRGIIIVGMQMWMRGLRPMFANLVGSDASAVLRPYMADLPLIDKEWAEMATTAVEGLRPLCRSSVEIENHGLLMDIVMPLHTSSWTAYGGIQKQYGWWIMLPHDKFQELIDLNNQTAVLLATHWIAIKQIMASITRHEHDAAQKSPPPRAGDGGSDPGMARWLRWLNAKVDFEHSMYNTWPQWVQEQLDRDMDFFGHRHPS